ncbi:hypothetical protein DID88_010043 [Monilinia fructigena]|uniref:Uncharacterized protein n=1 Tax=Monilinia fructigena TaxID=38457 RepID=A0A395IKZ4_9HELO|nr:hypothetical protein DID88_010043 [Monilinia fructigena]
MVFILGVSFAERNLLEDKTPRARYRRPGSSTKYTGKDKWFILGIFVQTGLHYGRIYMVRGVVTPILRTNTDF